MLLHCTDDGPGPVVVLLHGFPLDHTMWDAQRGRIGSVYRVLCPDLRGHGQSPLGDDGASVDAMADDVLETLDHLGLSGPVVLGGLSMGGYVALSIAARHPERLRGLMLINTRSAADTPETARVREGLAQIVESSGQVDPVVGTMLPKLLAPGTAAARPDLAQATSAVMKATAPASVAACLRGLATRPDRTADLSGITLPTLVIAGEHDQLIPRSESEQMARALPHGELVVIPDAGHLAPLENPEATNAAILKYLGSLG